jgi:hypothetical protein
MDWGCCGGATRRSLLGGAAAMLTAGPALADPALPAEVAGIAIPRSPLALKAASLARRACPDFLFNHCMRTFLFGALSVKTLGRRYDADEAFAAAALHDLGLLPAYASPRGSFEVDGADAADKLAREAGLTAAAGDVIWHAIVFHDGRFAITQRAGPEAMLTALGAGADVVGPGDEIDARRIAEIVQAFPRLGFKARFTRLLVYHCKRKPRSQRGTWLEGLCREHSPAAFTSTVEQQIAAAPFAE